MKKRGLTMEKKKIIEGYLFISPWIIGFLLFFLNPFLSSIRLSVSKITSFVGFKMQIIGMSNYVRAFVWDVTFVPMFVKVIQNTFISIPLILVFALLISILINRDIKMRGFFRGAFFLPVVLGTGFVMKQLLGMGVDDFAMDTARGIALPQELLIYLGPSVSGAILGFLNRITLVLWKSGVPILLFLAGLQGISRALYESAKCDGATEWEMFWKITLPMLSPVMLLNFVYVLIDSFTDVSNPIVDYIINTGFRRRMFEYASAMGWIYFLFVFILVLLVFFFMRKRVFNAGER